MMSWIKENLKRDQRIERFIREVSSGKHRRRRATALMELYVTLPDYPMAHYISHFMRINDVEINAYLPLRPEKILDRVSFAVFSRFRIDNGLLRPQRVFKSLGVTKFLLPRHNPKYFSAVREELRNVLSSSRSNLLSYKCQGVHLGDLIYDFHLRKRNLSTLDLESAEFSKDFRQFMLSFYWWNSFFKTNNVRFVTVSHTVYQQAMLARLGIKFGSKVFLYGSSRIYQLSSSNPFSDLEFLAYDSKRAIQFNYKIDLSRARKGLQSLMRGSIVTAAHAHVSGFMGENIQNIVSAKKSVRVMIATHCFSDAPHVYGKMLFDDFKEWLDAIAEFSKSSNYEWYAKAHPAFTKSDEDHFSRFLSENPNIKAIPSQASNLDLFRQGINVVLTVYGTIAFEAAYNDVVVVNASLNTPHVNFPFSLSPKSKREFIQILSDLEQIVENYVVDKEAVEHFFDLHHLRTMGNLLYGDKYPELLEYSGGYLNHFTSPSTLEFWMTHIKGTDHEKRLIRAIQRFLVSDEYFLRSSNIE